MFKTPKKQYDPQGREIIKGMAIEEYVPKAVVPHLVRAAQDQNLIWEKVIQDCTLFIDQTKHCSIMYKVGQWPFSGKLILTYNLCEKCNHRVSYPKKWQHLEMYVGKKYCY